MDLEARARAFFGAMEDVQVEQVLEFLRADAIYDVRDFVGPMGVAKLERYLRIIRKRLASVRFHVDGIRVLRNVTFVEWHNIGVLANGAAYRNHGVHVLSWDQDGKIAHASVYTEPEQVRALVGDEMMA